MEPWGRYNAMEYAEEVMEGEGCGCSMSGQPANRPIPPGQSVREQALGLARQVRSYPLAPEVVRESITKNTRSGV